MILEYTLLIACIIAIIGSFVLFFQNRKWESLIEKKQNQFNKPRKLKNKKSVLYQRGIGTFSVCFVVVIINFNHVWTANHPSLNDSNMMTFETYGSAADDSERKLTEGADQNLINEEIISAWQSNTENEDNYFLQNYDLAQRIDIDLTTMVDEFNLNQDDKQISVMIYQQENEYYAYFVDIDQIYLLTLK